MRNSRLFCQICLRQSPLFADTPDIRAYAQFFHLLIIIPIRMISTVIVRISTITPSITFPPSILTTSLGKGILLARGVSSPLLYSISLPIRLISAVMSWRITVIKIMTLFGSF
nr:MAG TPA: hypothetical protein [Caudoviricetes sp.]DAV16720.1 MAG TPA: hypothetical protein [Caudoviricetes sp.]